MRINVYSQELTPEVLSVSKVKDQTCSNRVTNQGVIHVETSTSHGGSCRHSRNAARDEDRSGTSWRCWYDFDE
jgi:hypothetical protein